MPCQPSAGGVFWDTHTNTNTHYTATSSSIQAPFGFPANPALMVHFGTHTPTPTHTTLLVASKQRSAALPTQRLWWCILGHTHQHTLHYTASNMQAPFGCPANPALVVHVLKISSQKIPPRPYKTIKFKRPRFELQIKLRYELHPGTQTTSQGWWCILGHTHQHQHTLHYTASSMQAPFGCPANPALVLHELERLRLCCSILPVRGIYLGQRTQHTPKTFHFVVPWAAEKNPVPKVPPPYKPIKSKRPRFRSKSNGDTNYTLARKQTRSAHRTPSFSIPRRIHRASRRCAGTFAPLLFYPARVVCRVCVRR